MLFVFSPLRWSPVSLPHALSLLYFVSHYVYFAFVSRFGSISKGEIEFPEPPSECNSLPPLWVRSGEGEGGRQTDIPPHPTPHPGRQRVPILVWFLLYRHLRMAHICGEEGSCHRPLFLAVTFLSSPKLVVWREGREVSSFTTGGRRGGSPLCTPIPAPPLHPGRMGLQSLGARELTYNSPTPLFTRISGDPPIPHPLLARPAEPGGWEAGGY